jgi:predicted KAP-like P-loop ATPase
MSGKPVYSDYPISRIEDDLLGWAFEAGAFAREVLSLNASRGLVAGVLGPWGSGKTSFVNLTRDEFRKAKVPVLDFNPWLFSGAEQLVDFFFSELSSQLRVRAGLGSIASQLTEYGQALEGLAWLPVAGAWMGRLGAISKVLKTLVGNRQVTASSRKRSLRNALLELSRPVVVVLDDIDRLTALV